MGLFLDALGVDEMVNRLVGALEEIEGASLLECEHMIQVEYRSITLKVEVNSLQEEAEVRAWAAVKGEAIRRKLLKPIDAENLLGVTDGPPMKRFFHEGLLNKASSSIA